MRVLHIITGLGTGGAEAMLLKLLTGIDRTRFEPAVISLGDEGATGHCIAALGIPVYALGMDPARPRLDDWRHLRALIRDARPDVVQTWMYHADLLGGLAAQSLGVRRVFWNLRQTNLDAASISRRTRQVVRACALLSRVVPTRILSCAYASRDAHVAAGYAAGKMVVIPNGFDTQRLRRDDAARQRLRGELGVRPGDIVVGHVGRFDPQKDHRTFVEAAGLAAIQVPVLRFVLVGGGIDAGNPALAEWITEAGLDAAVRLLGGRADVADLYSAFDVFVSSSMGEGFANVIGEAMACELPCVVTDVGDSAHIVADTGAVVPPGDPTALARALVDLAERPEAERRALGAVARRRIETNFSLAGVVAQYEACYSGRTP